MLPNEENRLISLLKGIACFLIAGFLFIESYFILNKKYGESLLYYPIKNISCKVIDFKECEQEERAE
ncbi:hypothetical protein [Acinetobacter sp. YH01009]|uniref:hypothetical protein n=1 Tax=Acinetobacter TaxID=469 RepID=UPI0015D3F386|nr:hypothetical protein [Acinetobacter sp. YH01009]